MAQRTDEKKPKRKLQPIGQTIRLYEDQTYFVELDIVKNGYNTLSDYIRMLVDNHMKRKSLKK